VTGKKPPGSGDFAGNFSFQTQRTGIGGIDIKDRGSNAITRVLCFTFIFSRYKQIKNKYRAAPGILHDNFVKRQNRS